MNKRLIDEDPRYITAFRRLSRAEKLSVLATIELFLDSPYHSALRHHSLRETPDQIRSLSAGDDLRILLRIRSDGTILLLAVGTHEAVYGEK